MSTFNLSPLRLNQLAQQGLLRQLKVVEVQNTKTNHIIFDGKPCLNFASNDYLALSRHSAINAALTHHIKHYGFGSGSATLIAGFYDSQYQLADAFKQWLNVEDVLIFSSGYHANIGCIQALNTRKSTILSDQLCHASIIDGIKLSSAASHRFKHNDIKHLQYCLKHHPTMIISEGIFSMQGNISPLAEIYKIAQQQQCLLMIDDAHGIGWLDDQGLGSISYCGLRHRDIDCITLPLGKTFNAMGAIVAGKRSVIENILQLSRSYRYTTALPPAICATLLTTLEIVRQQTWRRKKLLQNISLFNDIATTYQLPLGNMSLTPIRTLYTNNVEQLLSMQNHLLHHGFYTAAIRPPTVPKNQCLLRISLNTLHTESQITQLLTLIKNYEY